MDRTLEAQKIFSADRFATAAAGIKIIKADDNYALCRMDIRDFHLNANGIVMGGAVFTLADFAFAVATNGDPETMTVSVNSQINYLRAAGGSYLTAETSPLHLGRKSCIMEIAVNDDQGKMVAKAVITGMVTRRPQSGK